MGLIPPLGDFIGGTTCQYHADLGASVCGRPAAWHIIWTVQLDNSLACEEHMALCRTKWAYFGAHRVEPPCLGEGNWYDAELNRCFELDEDGRPLKAVAAYV